jgi:hypothetical protein
MNKERCAGDARHAHSSLSLVVSPFTIAMAYTPAAARRVERNQLYCGYPLWTVSGQLPPMARRRKRLPGARAYADPLHGWREQVSPELLEFLIAGKKSRYQWPATWLLIIWLISIVAIAGPTWRLEPSPFAEDATPLMIVLKADSSTEQPYPAPSRLEHARLKIADLAETR